MAKKKSWDIVQFIRFSLTGVLNTAVDFMIYMVLSYSGVGIFYAQTAGYLAGMLNSFVINRSWTFHSKERFFGRELARFLIVNLLTLGLSLGALAGFERLFVDPILIDMFGGPQDLTKVAVKLPVTVLTLTINFILSRAWVFHGREPKGGAVNGGENNQDNRGKPPGAA